MLLLSTATLHGYGVHRIFQFAKDAGYLGLDLSLGGNNHDLWDGDYIKELAMKFNLPVLSITAPPRSMTEKKVDRIIELAKKLDVQCITFTPPHFGDKNTTWYNKYLAKVKRDSHLSICIQNVEPKNIFFIIPEHKNATLIEIKKVTGDTTFDIGSIDNTSGVDIIKAQKVLGGSIKNIFFADKEGTKSGVLPGAAGGGISYLPLESMLMKLKTTGYKGFITIKIKPSEVGTGNQERVQQNLEYVKSYCDKHFYNFK